MMEGSPASDRGSFIFGPQPWGSVESEDRGGPSAEGPHGWRRNRGDKGAGKRAWNAGGSKVDGHPRADGVDRHNLLLRGRTHGFLRNTSGFFTTPMKKIVLGF